MCVCSFINQTVEMPAGVGERLCVWGSALSVRMFGCCSNLILNFTFCGFFTSHLNITDYIIQKKQNKMESTV